MPMDRYIGARVRSRRLQLRMSQTDLADQLGLTFQQVQKYERGANRIGAGRLNHIAIILQVTVPFFYEGGPGNASGKGDAPAPGIITDFMATPEGVRLVQALNAIGSAKLRRRGVELIELIATFKAE